MLKDEVNEVKKEVEELKNDTREFNFYEDVKFCELARNSRIITICLTVIICTMIIGFFVWLSIPDQVEKGNVEMNAENGDYSNINQNIGG